MPKASRLRFKGNATDLSIDAIISGDECVTDDAIAKWTPVWSRHANAQRRLEKSGA